MSDPFTGIIGHSRVIELLRRDAPEPAQAYLFVGPESVGKALLARQFAAAILCSSQGTHDIECRSCRLVASGGHPDVSLIEPEGATSLGVEQIRSVVTRAALRPVEGPRTVFLLPEAGTMTDQAANALLKTLGGAIGSGGLPLGGRIGGRLPANSGLQMSHGSRRPGSPRRIGFRARGTGPRSRGGGECCGGGRWAPRAGTGPDEPAGGR